MRWSLKLGRWLGIDVYLHVTFLLLLALVGLAGLAESGRLAVAFTWVLFFLGLFTCVLLHEYGHALMARRFGIRTHDITLLPIGGVARLEKLPDKPVQELWVALAGPAVNVVIALALLVFMRMEPYWNPADWLSFSHGRLAERWFQLNIMLVLFNLLPAFPMDGGRVLRSLLALKMDHARATRIAATVGKGMAVLFFVIGLYKSPPLLVIAFFVWIGASEEVAAAEMKQMFSGVRVRDAMITFFRTLAPWQTVGDAARLFLTGMQRDFPVVVNGQLLGWLKAADLLSALRKHGDAVSVSAVMRAKIEVADLDEPLEEALRKSDAHDGLPLAVFEEGKLVGLVTNSHLSELFAIREAMTRGARLVPPPWPGQPVPPLRPPSLLPKPPAIVPPPLPGYSGLSGGR